ncbi:hypothetical protein [Streptomyces sp. NPDC018045]|uniref:hypothetical protein n=1 Tax=Streptomyces sp. NPDC018045 TaxID=3365037 RepID=UPI0037B8495D
MAEGDRVHCRHLEVLREHGLVEDDADIRHQQYTLMAMLAGFLTADRLLADRAPDTPEIRADLLTRMVRRVLEAPGPDPVRATAATAAAPESSPSTSTWQSSANRRCVGGSAAENGSGHVRRVRGAPPDMR